MMKSINLFLNELKDSIGLPYIWFTISPYTYNSLMRAEVYSKIRDLIDELIKYCQWIQFPWIGIDI